MSTYFTSDTHFYHANVIAYSNRPFADVQHMNEDIVRRWNEVVQPTDTVYHLGDFSLSYRAVEIYSPRLNGTKYMVPGNHDFIHSVHPKSKHKENQDKWIANYQAHGWIVLPEQTSFEEFKLCHMPYVGDHTEAERYSEYRPTNDGAVLLHGHVHNAWKVKDRMINVGVDVHNYYPVSLDEIRKLAYNL